MSSCLHCLLWEICYSLIFVLLCVTCLFLLAAIKIFSLSLVLSNLNMLCHGMFLFMFIVLEFHWASQICEFVIIIKFGKFPVIFSLNIFCILISLFSPLDTNYTYINQLEAFIISQFTDVLFISVLSFPLSVLHFK